MTSVARPNATTRPNRLTFRDAVAAPCAGTVHPVSISCLPAHPEALGPVVRQRPNSTQHDAARQFLHLVLRSVDQIPLKLLRWGRVVRKHHQASRCYRALLRHTRLDVLIGGRMCRRRKWARTPCVDCWSADLRRIGGRRRRPRRVGVALHAAPRTRRSGYLARRRSSSASTALSIIDIEHSHQPLRWGPAEAPDRYALVFNGEIYNYVELREQLIAEFDAPMRTEGDSGPSSRPSTTGAPEAVERLRGMFAFAIWDTQTRNLFLARDPFGIKPLFLTTGPGHGLWQREEEHPGPPRPARARRRAGPPRLEHYIELQYVPEPETLHRSIGRLSPGATPPLSPVSRRPSPATSIRASTCDRSPPTPASRESDADHRGPCATRSPSTCVPTSPSARSCPAESIRRWSPPWPASTTPTSSPSRPASRATDTPRSTSPPKPPRRSGCATRSRS